MERSRVEIVAVDDEVDFWDDRSDLWSSLRETPPRIPSYFGYDALGSELFESITELPNYYLTRVEDALLQLHSAEIADLIGCGRIAELGSGSAKKTRLLLAACVERRPTAYLPIDVSREMLVASARELIAELPDLQVQGLWGRYETGLAWLRDGEPEPVVVIFLGSNLGNTTPEERDALLAGIADTLRPGDRFLVSVDLQKPGQVLEFYPRAHYDPATDAVESHLYATEDQSVALRQPNLKLELQRGDSLNVGYHYKFHRPQFVADVNARGFELCAQWIDGVWQYGILLFVRSN